MPWPTQQCASRSDSVIQWYAVWVYGIGVRRARVFNGVHYRIGTGHLTRRKEHGQRAEICRHEPLAWAACLTARLAAGRLGDRHAGTGPARCAGTGRRRARPHARTRRGEPAGCAGDGSAADRARGPPLGERRAAHQPALCLRLSRHRRLSPLPAQLRRRACPDAAHEARRDPEDPAHQRPAAQPRSPAHHLLVSAPVQQHEPAFPRRALQPERHRRQRHAADGAGKELRHRDRAARGPHARHLLVPSAFPRLGRCAGRERHGGRHRRRRRLRRCAGDRPRARARHAVVGGRVRRLLHGRGLRHALSGRGDALPGDQRPAAADDRHAAGGGAALAPGRLAVPEQHAAGARQALTERHRLRRHPAGRACRR